MHKWNSYGALARRRSCTYSSVANGTEQVHSTTRAASKWKKKSKTFAFTANRLLTHHFQLVRLAIGTRKRNGNSLLTVLVVHSIKTGLISPFFLVAIVLRTDGKSIGSHFGNSERLHCLHCNLVGTHSANTPHTPLWSVAIVWMVFALPVNIYEIEHFIIIVCAAFNINGNSLQHICIYLKWNVEVHVAVVVLLLLWRSPNAIHI